jgi:hypothetical protein
LQIPWSQCRCVSMDADVEKLQIFLSFTHIPYIVLSPVILNK